MLSSSLDAHILDSVIIVRINKCAIEDKIIHKRHVHKLLNLGIPGGTIAAEYGYVQTFAACYEDTRLINLSTLPLDPHEFSLLSKGLKYVPEAPPTARRLLSLAHHVERHASNLDTTNKNHTLAAAGAYLNQTAADFRLNANSGRYREYSTAVGLKKKLRTHNTIIVPSDKERIPILMDKTTYTCDVVAQLQQPAYTSVPKDPTKSVIESTKKSLMDLHKDNFLDKSLLRRLSPNMDCECPELYMCPKVHKGLNPIKYRPVVAYFKAPTMPLAKFLANILTTHLPESEHILANGRKFVEHIRHKTIDEGHRMYSLDICSMFTSIPHDLALSALFDFLFDRDFDTLPVNPCIIMTMTDLVISNTFFTFAGKFYKQVTGLPMGSPLSAPLAEIVVRSIESQYLDTIPHPIKFYHRYVDDTFLITHQDCIGDVVAHFNSIHPALQFTVETEIENRLPFLDVQLEHINGSIHTSVFRKPSRPLTTLHDASCHPMEHRNSALFFLLDRAREYCCEPWLYQEETQKVYKTLYNSGYSMARIQQAVNHRAKKRKNAHTTPQSERFLVLPYCGHNMAPLINNYKRMGHRVAVKPDSNLAQLLARPKVKPPRTNPNPAKGVVYSIPCRECDTTYVGQTGRGLDTRMKEHKYYISRQLFEKSPLVTHYWTDNHRIRPEDAHILFKEDDPGLRTSLERFAIFCMGNKSLNRKEEGIVSPFLQNPIRAIYEHALPTDDNDTRTPAHPVDLQTNDDAHTPPQATYDAPTTAWNADVYSNSSSYNQPRGRRTRCNSPPVDD